MLGKLTEGKQEIIYLDVPVIHFVQIFQEFYS